MTQIGGFTAVYDMLNLKQGMPASCFLRLAELPRSDSETTFSKPAFLILSDL